MHVVLASVVPENYISLQASTSSNSYTSLVISESWREKVWNIYPMYNWTFDILLTSTPWLVVGLYINCHLLKRVVFLLTVERLLIYGQKYKNFGTAYFCVHLVQYYYIVLWNESISVLRSVVFKASFYVFLFYFFLLLTCLFSFLPSGVHLLGGRKCSGL